MGPGFFLYFHKTYRPASPGGGSKSPIPPGKSFPPILVHRERDLEAIEFQEGVDIERLLREDEELIKIIISSVESGIL